MTEFDDDEEVVSVLTQARGSGVRAEPLGQRDEGLRAVRALAHGSILTGPTVAGTPGIAGGKDVRGAKCDPLHR